MAFDAQNSSMQGHHIQFRSSVSNQPERPLTPPYELRKEMTWLDFSSIGNPLGTPQGLIRDIIVALESGQASELPDCESQAFKSVLSQYFDMPAGSFLVGGTPNDLIETIAQAFPACSVGITTPSIVEYTLAIGNVGHKVVRLTSPFEFLTPEAASAREHGIVFDAAMLANPCYPTSRLLPRGTLVRYLESCDWVIVDERSIELTLSGESYVSLTREYKNLIIVRSISSSFDLTGIPIGYCIAHPDTIDHIQKFFDRRRVTMFSEVIGINLPKYTSHLDKAREFLDYEIPWFQTMLSLIPGIDIFPAEGNYVLCSFTKRAGMDLGVENLNELDAQLKRQGFIIRMLNDIEGLEKNRYFCVRVRSHEDNERLIKVLRQTIMSR